MNSQINIANIVDYNTWHPLYEQLYPADPLEFIDEEKYSQQIVETQQLTQLNDSIQTGLATICGIPIAIGIMDIKFMNGSMGSVVGEKATRLIELATNLRIPLILICASRGARIQEGIFSLIQMAKITSALHAYKKTKNSVYIAVLTSPTSGSVAASFAMLGDIVISEPQALIGFARRKGVQQKPFETSELLFEQGLLDIIVESSLFKEVLSEIIELYNESPCFYKKDVFRMSTNPQTWKKKNNLLEP